MGRTIPSFRIALEMEDKEKKAATAGGGAE
jgi:hypothetical protein